MEDSQSPKSDTKNKKILMLLGLLFILGSVATAWLVGWSYLPIDVEPSVILGLGLIIGFTMICCGSWMFTMTMSQRIPEYGELEIKFESGMDLYQDEEWEKALEIFKEVMGPEMNHKRALFYAAKCCEQMDDFEGVKQYCKYYIKMQSKDREAWEMLANAHKRLFEYEEAEDALKKAQKLGYRK